jgi:hypothetical protein
MTDDLTPPTETSPPSMPAADAGQAGEPATVATSEALEAAPARTEAVQTGGRPGSTRVRWAIGLVVAGLAVAVAIGAFIVLASRPVPEALKYMPADSMVVVEIRPDLPGDQLQKLGNLLAHFPGFKDQSTLADKLDETFSRLAGQASNGKVDYRADLKPWLSGPAFFAFRPAAGSSATDMTSMERGVVSLSTTGAVSCDVPFKDQTVKHESYKGLDIVLGGSDLACVIDGRQALLGDAASVHAAIDAHVDASGLDKSATYQQARDALEGDQLVTAYIDGKAYTSYYAQLLGSLQGSQVGSQLLPGYTPAFPAWAMEGFRAEDDAIVVDAFTAAPVAPTAGASPGPSLLPIPAGHASALTAFAPANTLFFLELQGAGVGAQNLLSVLRTYPQLQQPLQMLDGAGGAGQLLGWIQDAGVIVVNGADGPTGGVLVSAKDETTASDRVTTLLGLVAMLGLGNNNVQSHESTIGGVKVTTISVANLASLIPPGQLPPGMDVPTDAKVEFSIAAKGSVILLGSGDSFMNAVLGVQPGSGLVDQAAYKRATARALPNSQVSIYIGVRDVIALAEKALPTDAKAKWESDLMPYTAPFEALSLTSSTGDSSSGHARFIFTINNP